MNRILFILQKEFIQIFRNKGMLPIIFVVPIIQLLILVNAADFEVANIRIAVQDRDHSIESRKLIAGFEASTNFNVQLDNRDFKSLMKTLDNRSADMFMRIPPGFSKGISRKEPVKVMLDVDGIDGQKANVSYFYASNIIQRFYRDEMRAKLPEHMLAEFPTIEVRPRYWYNPELEYKNLMVPGLLAVLVTMVGMFLSSMNIVREKEIGTIEQLNVTPITKFEFLVGKLFPFWVISMFELAFGLILGVLIFDIPVVGNLVLLFSFTGLYLVVMLGFGLLISTFTYTQQQAMFISWFFLVIFILMGGLFTAIENMPEWAQRITWFNPVSYFIEVLRLVLLKGSGLRDILPHFGVMAIMALVLNSVAIANYRKRTV